jgi:hypothetical protein
MQLPKRVINGPRAASELGPLILGQRTCSDYFSMSVSCQTRKSLGSSNAYSRRWGFAAVSYRQAPKIEIPTLFRPRFDLPQKLMRRER